MDGDAAVVAHPEGFDHAVLQSLGHVLLGHMEDPQVRETDGKTQVSGVGSTPSERQREAQT